MAKDMKINKSVLAEQELYPGAPITDKPIIGGGDASGTTKYLSMFDRINEAIDDGDIVLDTVTEVVASDGNTYSATMQRKSGSVTHTTTSAGTNVIPVNVPVGAQLGGAKITNVDAVTFSGGGTEYQATWTASTQNIGAASDGTAATSVQAIYDASTDSPIVSGSVETITLTADAGTIDAGSEVVVNYFYYELS